MPNQDSKIKVMMWLNGFGKAFESFLKWFGSVQK